MVVTRKEIARRLRSARQAAELTQAAVAKETGLHRPTISEIEAGRRAVSAEELHELSRLYLVPVSVLLDEDAAGGADHGARRVPGKARRAVQRSVGRMARVIVRRFDPERIILFGSHARGTAGPDSDVDLLVVMEVDGSTRRKAAEIGAALHDFTLPKDIIVTTPAEFAWRKDVVGTIERPAVREGRVLYVRG